MDRSQRILPVYTGDVSGACSALFELGGMVVIHDPSGCNSTYNTHDETRWYDHDSLIFISGLMERDAILGNDDKFVSDVVDAALELGPRFVALCNSPIPYITGTDMVALARMVERRTSIPSFYVPTNGMHDYVMGAGHALAEVAKRFVRQAEERPGTANILGVTPLDFAGAGRPGTWQGEPAAWQGERLTPSDLRRFVEEAGFGVVSCWAMDSTLDDLAQAAQAQVNLVVSSVGLPAARELRERFGTPYVVGQPTGPFSATLATALREAAQTGACSWPCRDVRASSTDGTRCIVGEPVAAGSEAAARELAGEPALRVVCAVEADPELLGPGDVRADGEGQVEAALAQARLVVADPFYHPVCPPAAKLEPHPHLAFSGRGYLPNS